jgi:hypothetical protein
VLIPYPVIQGDYWANIGYWWDLEFWNRSVDFEAGRPNEFSGTPPGSFPKLDLTFDSRTGRANIDPPAFVLQAVNDSRFHIAGVPRVTERGVNIVTPAQPWRADWVSYGMYDDGWTRPRQVAHIRVFAEPGQTAPEHRTITLVMLAPESAHSRAAVIASNAGRWPLHFGQQSVTQAVTVCVPPKRYADVTVTVRGASAIPGDQRNVGTFGVPRTGGILLQQIALADETSAC